MRANADSRRNTRWLATAARHRRDAFASQHDRAGLDYRIAKHAWRHALRRARECRLAATSRGLLVCWLSGAR